MSQDWRRAANPARSQRERLLDGRAWREFCRDLETAGRHVLEFPLGAAESEELRAEGFRYLLGLVRSGLLQALELSDPDQPRWVRNPDSQAKWGAENPDNQYLWARIGPHSVYRIQGERGSAFDFLIEVKQGYLQLGDEGVYASCTASDLTVDADGRFELLLAAKRPSDWRGDFLPIHEGARYVAVRQYLVDWEREQPARFEIFRVGGEGAPAEPLSAASVADRIDAAGEWTLATATFWSQWVERLREAWRPGQIAPAQRYAGGAPDIFYGNSWYRLGEGEALVFESELPEARYWQIELCDAWFRSLDYATRQSSLNHLQARVGADRRLRVVVAHRDPGVANWLDTAGHGEGVLQYRWVWARTNPAPTLRSVRFEDLARELPGDTPRVSSEERRRALAARQRQVLRREPVS
jgi:hypothetical protein